MSLLQVPVLNPLPSVLNLLQEEKKDIVVMNAKLDIPLEIKKVILVISKDIDEESMKLFKDFKILEYDHDIHANLPISSYDWDILVLDIREKGDRYCYLKEVVPNKNNYKVVVYCYAFENELIEEPDNVLNKLPEKQARKEDFYMLLLTKRIKKPRWYVSLFACILSTVNSTKN
jgi:hypothetical protein